MKDPDDIYTPPDLSSAELPEGSTGAAWWMVAAILAIALAGVIGWWRK